MAPDGASAQTDLRPAFVAWWGIIPTVAWLAVGVVWGWPAAATVAHQFAFSYWVGATIVPLLLILLVAWIAYRVAGRSQLAGTLTFCGLVALATLGQLSTYLRDSQKAHAEASGITLPRPLPNNQLPGRSTGTSATATQSPIVPVNDPALWAYARHIKAMVDSANPVAINNCLDMREWLQIVESGVSLPEAFRQSFEAAIITHFGFGPALAFQMKHGGKYTLLGVRKISGQNRAVFRFRSATGSVNYNEWVLMHGPEGRVVATDIFSVTSGELVSVTVRRNMLLFLAKMQPTLWQRLTGQESAILAPAMQCEHSQHLLVTGHNRAFLADLAKLPASLRNSRSLLLEKVEAIDALYGANTPKYARRFQSAVLTYQRAFPDDPAAALMDIDYLYSTHQFRKEAEINIRISKSVGGDPYQIMLAAAAESKIGTPAAMAQSQKYADQAIHGVPSLKQAYWIDISISLQRHNFKQVTRTFLAVRKQFHLHLMPLTGLAEYAEYVKSPEYAKYLRAIHGDSAITASAGAAAAAPN